MGFPGRQIPALATYTSDSAFPASRSPTDFHTGASKNCHPNTTVHQQEPAPLSPHFHLVAFTRKTPASASPQNLLSFFQSYINTTRNDGSKNSAMAAIEWQQTWNLIPANLTSQRGTHLLIKTVSIGPSRMETPTGLSEALTFKQRFPTFHYRTSSLCCLPIFSSLEPSKTHPEDKQDFNRSREASSHVIFPFQRKFRLLETAPFFSSSVEPPPHPKRKCPIIKCFSFNENEAFNRIIDKEFLLSMATPFHAFEPGNTIPQKSCMQLQWTRTLPHPWKQVQETYEGSRQ